jgi:hypothetical protein
MKLSIVGVCLARDTRYVLCAHVVFMFFDLYSGNVGYKAYLEDPDRSRKTKACLEKFDKDFTFIQESMNINII